MTTPPFTSRRPEILLGILLSACLVALSLQVRRPTGETLGERWLQSLLAPFVDVVSGLRTASGDLSDWSSSRRTLLSENRRLRDTNEALEAELLRLRGVEHDRDRLLALSGRRRRLPPAPSRRGSWRWRPPAPSGPRCSTAGRPTAFRPARSSSPPRGFSDASSPSAPERPACSSFPTSSPPPAWCSRGRAAPQSPAGTARGAPRFSTSPRSRPWSRTTRSSRSGTDGLYPTDLPVGRVVTVNRKSDSLFWDIRVAMAADPAKSGTGLHPAAGPDVRRAVRHAGPALKGARPGGLAPPHHRPRTLDCSGRSVSACSARRLRPTFFFSPWPMPRGAAGRRSRCWRVFSRAFSRISSPFRAGSSASTPSRRCSSATSSPRSRRGPSSRSPRPSGGFSPEPFSPRASPLVLLLWILRGEALVPSPLLVLSRAAATGLLAGAFQAAARVPWRERRAARRRMKLG